MLILLYRYTTWTLTKHIEKKVDGICTRIQWAILNKSWKQHSPKQLLYGHLPPISKTIQIRQTRHVGHWWRNKNELISNVLQWTPLHGCASVRWPARTYLQQICTDTRCSLGDLLEAMEMNCKRESGKSMLAVQYDDDDHCLYTIKCFQVFLFIVCPWVNGFNYRKWLSSSIWILIGIPTGTSGLEQTWELCQWRITPHSQKDWSLTIRCYLTISYISRIFFYGRGLTPLQRCRWYILLALLIGLLFHV